MDWASFKSQGSLLAQNAARFDAEKTRKRLIHQEGFKAEQIVRYFARPFDFQWCYYSSVRPLWNEPRPQLWDWSCIPGNHYLVSRQVRGGNPEGPPFYFLTCIGDDHALRTDAYFFPMRAHDHAGNLFAKTEICNLSLKARSYIEGLGFTKINDHADCYSSPWWHALAIGFSPSYLAEHSEGIAIGWPRIPMPAARADFDRSTALGKHLADILSPDAHVTGITGGTLAEHQRVFGVLSAADLVVRGWGHLDTQRRVNPGKGRVEKRHYTSAEQEAIRRGAEALGIEEARALELLGPPIDIYLNGPTVGDACRRRCGSISSAATR
jgi:Type ISP C-terminal specificity domain